jgi:FkbM family methyltransferase
VAADASVAWGIEHVDGTFVHVAVPHAADDPLAAALLEGSASTPPVADLVTALTEPGDVVVDVGAHLGLVSLPLSHRGRTVVAIEPSPDNHDCLRRSAERNGFGRLRTVHAALSDRDGDARMVVAGPFSQLTDDGPTPVRVLQMSTLCAETGLWPAVIKIDVEGHEPACLASLVSAAGGRPLPDLVIESNGHCQWVFGSSSTELVASLRRSYRHLYTIHDRSLRRMRFDGPIAQSITVIDVLATDRDEVPWPVRPPATDEELVRELLSELDDPNPWQRRWAAWAAGGLPAAWQADERVAARLARLRDDEVREVREAATPR